MVRSNGNGEKARTEGTLEITETCVFLTNHRGEHTLLAWPSVRTRWLAEPRAIDFANRGGQILTFFDGTAVAVGGSGGAVVARLDWAAPPRPECRAQDIWFIGDVAPL